MDFKKSKASYEKPECEVIRFAQIDIITTSDIGAGDGFKPGNSDSGAWDDN